MLPLPTGADGRGDEAEEEFLLQARCQSRSILTGHLPFGVRLLVAQDKFLVGTDSHGRLSFAGSMKRYRELNLHDSEASPLGECSMVTGERSRGQYGTGPCGQLEEPTVRIDMESGVSTTGGGGF